jgi:hypothetical protein
VRSQSGFGETLIEADGFDVPVTPSDARALDLTEVDRATLDDAHGRAVGQAMRILCAMAAQQGEGAGRRDPGPYVLSSVAERQ